MPLSREDMTFLLYDWLDAVALADRERYREHDRETFDAVLDLAETIAVDHYSPHNKRNDAEEPAFDGETITMIPDVKQALEVLAKSGLIGSTFDAAIGGMQLPYVVATACFAWFQAANVASWAYTSLAIANANLLSAYGTAEQIDLFVKPMIEGRYHGTMCLSEPQAGSTLTDIRARADRQSDGSYRVTGNKMWISGGDHALGENIIHLVLARIPNSPPGVKGLSLFIVPKYLVDQDGSLGERNDVTVAGLNHKMGFRGTTNVLLNFGEGVHRPGGRAGAVGFLVGNPNQGLTCMFHMMNEARIAVGAQAAAVGYTAYLKSLGYARTRRQGRPLDKTMPTGAPVPIIDHPDVRRMLLAQKCYVEGALALVLYCGRLVDDQLTAETPKARRDAGLLVELLTPIAKSWPSEWCLRANDLAIQVHGGYGYTRDYDVEQHYRDNRLNPIHEGTTGIQGLDLLGRKVVQHDGEALGLLDARIRRTLARAERTSAEATLLAHELAEAWSRTLEVARTIHGSADPERFANATLFLQAFGHTVMAWIWLEQFLASGPRIDPFGEGKRQAARYFFRYELPRTGPQLDLLDRVDRTCADMNPQWF